ncbi:hypothetical protein TNCV_187191 [Trichonephila clavipes]|nr:hypothetical protein TNCV_187191 [Trichonephila clavipes]
MALCHCTVIEAEAFADSACCRTRCEATHFSCQQNGSRLESYTNAALADMHLASRAALLQKENSQSRFLCTLAPDCHAAYFSCDTALDTGIWYRTIQMLVRGLLPVKSGLNASAI